MGAVTVKATAVSNADQLYPRVPTGTFLSKGEMYSAVGTLAVGATDSAGSIYRFCRVPSGARMDAIKIFSDAISGFTSASVGVYKIQDSSGTNGASVSTALFASGVDLSVAQTEPYDVIFNNLGIANMEKRVWELLGLASDPQLMYDIAITSVTQSGAAGNLSMTVSYVI